MENLIEDIQNKFKKYNKKEVPIEEVFKDAGIEASELDKCPECGSQLASRIETREGGYFETISYCNSCGWTGVSK